MDFAQFMMDFELKLEKPNVSRAWISAATMGLSYFIGMFVVMKSYAKELNRKLLTFDQAVYCR